MCGKEAKIYYPSCNEWVDSPYIALCDEHKDEGLKLFPNIIVMSEEQFRHRENKPILDEIDACRSRIEELKEKLI